MNLREAAQDALTALNGVLDTYGEPLDKLSIAGGTFEALVCRDAITALRAALAQPEPAAPTEPAPGWCKHCRQYTIEEPLQAAPTVVEPARRVQKQFMDEEVFYAAPPRAALTDEQIRDLWSWSATCEAERTATTQQHAFARAIEAAHGIGGPRNE